MSGIKIELSFLNSIPLVFGAEVAFAGFVGVGLGGYLSTKLRHKFERSDPLIAASGLVISAPILLTALFLARDIPIGAMVLVFFAMIGINLNWAIVADITLVSTLSKCMYNTVLMFRLFLFLSLVQRVSYFRGCDDGLRNDWCTSRRNSQHTTSRKISKVRSSHLRDGACSFIRFYFRRIFYGPNQRHFGFRLRFSG